ncbi:MAG: AraC family transcriptional regulator [Rhizomicrobium sp.]|jgi:AraC-like DNA-binding protein
MTSDPFADILRLTSAETVVTGEFSAGGAWAVRWPALNKIMFASQVKGRCWLAIDVEGVPVRLETGDVILFSAQRPFVMASDLSVVPVGAASIFTGNGSDAVAIGSGEECASIGGYVRLNPANGWLLTDVLPPVIHVHAASPSAPVLRWLLDQLLRERTAALPGARLATAQLAQLMLVQVLRAHLDSACPVAAGWLRVLADPRLAPALRLMHGEPGRTWTLDDLAKAAAMSRTSFAQRFRTAAGVAPLAYLTQWRMRLAERALRDDDGSVGLLARSLGYASESAFSNAFKRVTGHAPRRYRTAARAQRDGAEVV